MQSWRRNSSRTEQYCIKTSPWRFPLDPGPYAGAAAGSVVPNSLLPVPVPAPLLPRPRVIVNQPSRCSSTPRRGAKLCPRWHTVAGSPSGRVCPRSCVTRRSYRLPRHACSHAASSPHRLPAAARQGQGRGRERGSPGEWFVKERERRGRGVWNLSPITWANGPIEEGE